MTLPKPPLTMGEFLAHADTPRDWIIEGLLASNHFGLLSANPKVGKSFLARCIALAVARGRRVLGRETARGRVLIASLEDAPQDAAAHMRSIEAEPDDPIYWMGPEHFPPTGPERVDALVAAIAEYRPVLTVLDTIWRLIPVEDGNDPQKVMRATAPILEASRAPNGGSAVLALTHNRKSGGQHGEQVAGSNALFGTADVLVSLERPGAGVERTVTSTNRTGREIPSSPLVLNGGWVEIGESKADAERKADDNATLAALGDTFESQNAIARQTGIARDRIKPALLRCVAAGWAESDGGSPHPKFRKRQYDA